MGKILSQEEIDALLVSQSDISTDEAQGDTSLAGAITYNFRRPDRVSKDQIRSLHFLHDRFARNVATSMSAFLRTVSDMTIVSVEQFAYSEFLMSLPDPTAFYAIGIEPFDLTGAMELNPSIAFTMIDRMLGGNGSSGSMNRALTEIEQNVIDSVIKLLLENLTEAWKSIVETVEFTISGRETRPQMLSVAAPNEVVVLLVFDVRVGETRGMLNLCIPASITEAAGETFAQGWHRTRKEPTRADRRRLRENLGRMPMPVVAEIGAKLAARELLDLRPGDILSLGHSLRRAVDVKVGHMTKYTGHLTRVENNSGVAIASATHAWRQTDVADGEDSPASHLVPLEGVA